MMTLEGRGLGLPPRIFMYLADAKLSWLELNPAEPGDALRVTGN